jgi:hypothetical protein
MRTALVQRCQHLFETDLLAGNHPENQLRRSPGGG